MAEVTSFVDKIGLKYKRGMVIKDLEKWMVVIYNFNQDYEKRLDSTETFYILPSHVKQIIELSILMLNDYERNNSKLTSKDNNEVMNALMMSKRSLMRRPKDIPGPKGDAPPLEIKYYNKMIYRLLNIK